MINTSIYKLRLWLFISLSFFCFIVSAQEVIFNYLINNYGVDEFVVYNLDSCTWVDTCGPGNSLSYTIDKVYQNADDDYFGAIVTPSWLNIYFYPFIEYDTKNCHFPKGDSLAFYPVPSVFYGNFDDFGDFWTIPSGSLFQYDINTVKITDHYNVGLGSAFEGHRPTLYYKGKIYAVKPIDQYDNLVVLDTENPEKSEVLIQFPIQNVGLNNLIEVLFKIRNDCENYSLYAYVGNLGVYEIDMENQEFIYKCPPFFQSGSTGSGSRVHSTYVPLTSQNGCDITIDLDLDDNSGAQGGDYYISLACDYTDVYLTDRDLDIFSDHWVDSITISFENTPPDGVLEYIQVGEEKGTHTQRNNSQNPSIINEESHDFIPLRRTLRKVKYFNDGSVPTIEDRHIVFVVYGKDGQTDTARVTLHFITAGTDASYSYCDEEEPIYINDLLSSTPEIGGYWYPAIDSLTVFDPSENIDAVYHYVMSFDGCPNDTSTVSLSVYTEDDIEYMFHNPSCVVDTPAILHITSTSSNSYLLNNELVISDTDIILFQSGNYYITQIDQNNCTEVDSFEYIVPEGYQIELGDTIQVAANDEITIEVNTTQEIAHYDWYIDGMYQEEDKNPLYFTPLDNQVFHEIIVVTTDEMGCTNSDTLIVKIVSRFENIEIPNTIIPADEGDFAINRYFIIFGPNDHLITEYQIFNRWGQFVYQTKDLILNDMEQSWWDGTSNGKEAVGGTYMYKIVVESPTGEKEEYKGKLYLLR